MKAISDNIEVIKKHFAKHLLKLRKANGWEDYHRTKFQIGNDMFGNAVIYCHISYIAKVPDTNYKQRNIKYAHLEIPYEILRREYLEKELDSLCYDSNPRKEYSKDNSIRYFLLRFKEIGENVLEEV